MRQLFTSPFMRSTVRNVVAVGGLANCQSNSKASCDERQNKKSQLTMKMKETPLFQESGLSREKQILATSVKNDSREERGQQPTEYDFVVIGNGNAGRSALKRLRRLCPLAKIAIVDPLRPCFSSDQIDCWAPSAVHIKPAKRSVQLANGQEITYRHELLIATGSRAAPPPETLLDPSASDRILELRSTRPFETNRPLLSPRSVRHLVLIASSQGAKVGVVGSGWEALELAVAALKAGQSSLLSFGSAGPLSHILPRYLSTAVTRRLRKEGIDVHERSLVRYIANDNASFTIPRLELHTCKSYDLVDTQRSFVDLLVLAPKVNGSCGTSVIPTYNTPEDDSQTFDNGKEPWYRSLSQLTSGNSLVCHLNDGRLVVNAEMNAASRIFAAGSCAKYPNSLTGHVHVAGEGSYDAALAGEIAATHMSRNYHERRGVDIVDIANNHDLQALSFALESFPIWRSDQCCYLTEDEDPERSALESVGIRALCVGHCDSDRMATHGFWWTNQSVERRRTTAGGNRKIAKRRTVSRAKSPIYGKGVVFYIDRTGTLCGIMTWGLPFTISTVEDDKTLNADLVNRMKTVIKSNGGAIRSLEGDVLRTDNLIEESKNLISLALGKTSSIQPLYRYSRSKPPNIAAVGLLRRKDQSSSSELLGENLFVQDNPASEEDVDRPESLVYVHRMDGIYHSSEEARAAHNKAERMERLRQENELRGRPPKEEPLWLRRGDAMRLSNVRAVMAEQAEENMRAGKFADGSDAVKQAKVPAIVLRTQETVREWMATDDNEDND